MILLEEEIDKLSEEWLDADEDVDWATMMLKAQLKKVLNAFMILGGDGGNPNNPHPFHYAISRDVYLQWLKECEE